MPVGKEVVVIVSTEEIVIPNAWVWVCGGTLESATFTLKFDAPAVVGVPEIAPDDGLSVNPAGSDPAPETRLYVYGVVPPLAASSDVL